MSRHVCLMGVSGAGKSTLGPLLAQRLGLPFKDADDFHPPANIAKQAAGHPLTDDDRWPWLDAIGAHLRARPAGAIVGCSALKRIYRDRLRQACPDLVFLHLTGDPALIAARQAARKDHFMPASLIASQLATLERPEAEEGVIALDIGRPPEALAEEAARCLGA
ncbi:gluconokinase [Roseomonas sp. CCTCC AB2023176]|uniref:gluconokinase n=1 Tax=Roseomonas sp. CCTCC AB2023176 TaxID=3342640 RepID=UPI0035DE4C06